MWQTIIKMLNEPNKIMVSNEKTILNTVIATRIGIVLRSKRRDIIRFNIYKHHGVPQTSEKES